MKSPFLSILIVALATLSLSFTAPPTHSSVKRARKSLAFPVAGKTSIRDKWGASRDGGIRKHKGIDIHARKGTPVVAISSGVVVNRDHTPIGGKTLWLKSDDYGWVAYYAHLDKQLVKEGQYVKKGQVIGTVGNTGNARSTPPHLHFGISQDNRWINPLPYVKHSSRVTLAKKAPSKKTRQGTRNHTGKMARR